jgi:hypothetical protein
MALFVLLNPRTVRGLQYFFAAATGMLRELVAH